MIHLGDITKIKGYEAPIVDCIIGGSPCQDLSLAGKRAGLAGARSGLYMEQIRLIKEMREYDRSNGRTGVDVRPRYMVWENVPGAFSTNEGQDFAAVLEEAIRVAEPEAPNVSVPEKGWPTAGCIIDEMGKWSVAWRVMDAQYWGVPQRRRRICLVCDFNGLNAPKIVFGETEHHRSTERNRGDSSVGHSGAEPRPQVQPFPKGLSRNPDESQQERKATAGDAGEGVGGAVPFTLKIRGGCEGGGKGALIQENKSATPSTLQDQTLFQPVISVDQGGGKSGANHYEDISPTLTCTHGGEPAVVYGIDQQGGKGGANYSVNVSPPILSDSHGTPHAVAYGWPLGFRPENVRCYEETATTLCNGTRPGFTTGVIQPLCIEMTSTKNTIIEDGVCPTITARMGTCGNQVNAVLETYQKVTGPLMANSHPGSYTGQDAYSDMLIAGVDCRNATKYPEMNATLQSDAAHNLNSNNVVRVKHIVRRLTPLECERLQGFPDDWTDIGEWIDSKGKKHKEADSPRYKALGNSIAIPPWKWVLKRLCACYERDATMASLFDGISGFPLIWTQLNGWGSVKWSSEIDEFPMAVCKKHFGDEETGEEGDFYEAILGRSRCKDV